MSAQVTRGASPAALAPAWGRARALQALRVVGRMRTPHVLRERQALVEVQAWALALAVASIPHGSAPILALALTLTQLPIQARMLRRPHWLHSVLPPEGSPLSLQTPPPRKFLRSGAGDLALLA